MKYYKIDIKVDEQFTPPYFMGSQLRGAFGYALKKVVCINPSYECANCFTKSNCLFYSFFMENSYHKYRFDIRLKRDSYNFSFFLYDEACENLAFVLSSFYQLLTSVGLGKDKKCFENFKMYVNNTLVYDNGNFQLQDISPNEYILKKTYKNVLVDIQTPIRIKKDNKFVYDDSLNLLDILVSSRKRYEYIYPNEEKIEVNRSFEILSKNLYKKNLTRYSNPQKTKMRFDGLMGNFIVRNLSEENYKILKIAELLNVGKQTVFGLGKIEVKEI